MVFDQQVRKLLLGRIPAAFPTEHDPSAKTNWIYFLTHSFSALSYSFARKLNQTQGCLTANPIRYDTLNVRNSLFDHMGHTREPVAELA